MEAEFTPDEFKQLYFDWWEDFLVAMLKLCIEDILNEDMPEPGSGPKYKSDRRNWRRMKENAQEAREMLVPGHPLIELLSQKTGKDQADFIAMVYEAAKRSPGGGL